MAKNLAHWQPSNSTQQEISKEYQHDKALKDSFPIFWPFHALDKNRLNTRW